MDAWDDPANAHLPVMLDLCFSKITAYTSNNCTTDNEHPAPEMGDDRIMTMIDQLQQICIQRNDGSTPGDIFTEAICSNTLCQSHQCATGVRFQAIRERHHNLTTTDSTVCQGNASQGYTHWDASKKVMDRMERAQWDAMGTGQQISTNYNFKSKQILPIMMGGQDNFIKNN